MERVFVTTTQFRITLVILLKQIFLYKIQYKFTGIIFLLKK